MNLVLRKFDVKILLIPFLSLIVDLLFYSENSVIEDVIRGVRE